jgi:cytochrome c biogenesis protein CcdA/thiol-disulfide isomerase/thioredoxin
MRKKSFAIGLLLSFLVMVPAAATAPKPDMLFYYSKDCEHCAAIRKDVLPDFLKKYGDTVHFVELEVSEPAIFDSLLAMESRVQFPEDQKDYPAVYFLGMLIEGEIPVGTRLESLVKMWIANPDSLAALNREVLSRKAEVFPSDSGRGSKPVHMAYFYKQGCKKCSRAKEIIIWLEKNYQNVKIDSFDIAEEHSKLLSIALGLRNGVSENRLMSTPMFFAGKEYVLSDSISQKRLTDLVTRLSGTGAEAAWNSMSEKEMAAAKDFIERKFDTLSLAAVALAALGDGINPCAFATILFFVSYLTMLKRKKNEIAAVGLTFAFAVFLTYFLVGLGFLNVVKSITNIALLSKIIFGGAAALCLVFGFLSISDYFKARAGNVSGMSLQLPAFLKKRIHATIREQARTQRLVLGALTAGFLVSILEFACTGQVYLPTITYMASRKASAIGYLLLYNVLFIFPLLAVFGIVYYGASSQAIARVMEQKVGSVKLVLATVFFVVGGLLFWTVFA